MSDNSKIEWTDATWNPIRCRTLAKQGWYCEHVSPACEHCYAEGINHRLGTGLPFKPGHFKDVEIFIDEQTLLAPLRWKRPRMIFVCSMSDLFGPWVKVEWIDRICAVMALCPQHKFQVLTKRSERMREYFKGPYPNGNGVMGRIADATFEFAPHEPPNITALPSYLHTRPVGPSIGGDSNRPEFGFRRFLDIWFWPLPNVWLGASTEDQQRADERIPLLLDTPAAVRFVSLEPLLSNIDLAHFLWRHASPSEMPGYVLNDAPGADYRAPRGLLHWAIVGGESGPGARPMHPDWARSIRDQCQAAGVPYFFKQWGEFSPNVLGVNDTWPPARVGKKAAGRLLDGVEHNGMPT